MTESLGLGETSAHAGDLLTPSTVEAESPQRRDRRREKPQLSCTFCRRRKVRCDRQLPCQTCVVKGIALSCSYAETPYRKGTVSVGERIQELEALVRSLMQQQQQQQQQHQELLQTPTVPSCGSSMRAPARPFGNADHISGESPQSVSAISGRLVFPTSTNESAGHTPASYSTYSPLDKTKDDQTSPASSDHGSMRSHLHGAGYVSSVHWAAVLDSISDLKDHYEMEEEERVLACSDSSPQSNLSPRLLYQPVQATKADILASIPARPVVDRMVSRYFNAPGFVPVVLHSGQFLREYETFWQESTAVPFTWIGLLFGMMCISTQHQQSTESSADPDILIRAQIFRERTVHCLVLGKFTRGGPHVLETLVHHCFSEAFMCKDADIGLWLLLGMLVQLALSQGYHRDARNFPGISPFNGEMRRRVWAAIIQMDLRLASLMGLPRLLKPHQCDTAEPRNLLDSDFDEASVELPPSRPETEITPVLYVLAKNRIDSVSGLIVDLADDTREHPYAEIIELDRKLHEAEASLPPAFRWQPLSKSFMVPPQIIMYRVWFQVGVQRLAIWLHRKYLAPSHTQASCGYSRHVCVAAAIKILEFQKLVDEETQPDGQLYAVRWMRSSLLKAIFLLAMSVLCYYVQLAKSTPDVPLDRDTAARIRDLLRATYPSWLHSSTVSRAAQEAVKYLDLLLGLRVEQDLLLAEEPPDRPDAAEDTILSFDQVAWDAYQDCISNFPAAFGTDFVSLDALGPFPPRPA